MLVEYYTHVYIFVVKLQHNIQHPLTLSKQLRVFSLLVMFVLIIIVMLMHKPSRARRVKWNLWSTSDVKASNFALVRRQQNQIQI